MVAFQPKILASHILKNHIRNDNNGYCRYLQYSFSTAAADVHAFDYFQPPLVIQPSKFLQFIRQMVLFKLEFLVSIIDVLGAFVEYVIVTLLSKIFSFKIVVAECTLELSKLASGL